MKRHMLLVCSLTFALLVLVLGDTQQADSRADDKPKVQGRHALLVGCANYPNLAKRFQLVGPANDALLMRDLLVKQFNFPEANISLLTDAEGKAKGDKFLPNRANIEREFKALTSRVKEGDYVVIFMAGHGSQQPENPKSPDPEPDGLDEIFLPRDVGKWDDGVGTVKNAIIDDELGDWLKAIQKKKASLWVMIDSCHSGSITRSTKNERVRDVKPEAGLGIPKKALDEAREKALKRESTGPVKTRGAGPVDRSTLKMAQAGGMVCIYAAQAHEVTIEMDLPENAKTAKSYGLLTYAITQVLTQAKARGKPITYKDMVYQVHQIYETMGRTFPTPVIEGGDVNREVLGERKWDAGFRIVLTKDKDDFRISAGSLHGMTTGSVLAVSPAAGSDEVVGHVRIESVEASEAVVVPCAFDKKPAASKLPDKGLCKVVYVDMGDLRLKLSVDALDSEAKAVPKEWREKLLAEVKKLEKPGSVIAAVDDPAKADWLLRKKGADVVLAPAGGKPTTYEDSKSRAFGPVPQDEEFGKWLTDRVGRITRAQNLRKLAAKVGSEGEGTVAVQTELWLAPNLKDRKGSIKLEWPSTKLRFYDGDRLIVRMTNPNRFPIDATLLVIDSNYQIAVLWPDEEVNRIRPKETEYAHPIRLKATTTGQEHLLVIAVRGRTREPVDFRGLAQPGLERARGSDSKKKAMDSPLGQVLTRALFGQGTTRGMEREATREFTAELLPYQMMKGKRPAPPK